MARRKPARKASRSYDDDPGRVTLGRILLLAAVCAAVGGFLVWKFNPVLLASIRGAAGKRTPPGFVRPAPEETPTLDGATEPEPAEAAPAVPVATPSAAERRKLAEMEREVGRLRKEIDARDRENAELKIQLKLMQAGSRLPE